MGGIATFAFLPNLRSGAAAAARVEGIRARVDYELEVIADGQAQPGRLLAGAQLRGPGDVVGLEPGQITRIEPEAVNRGFEPNYFPFVEFRDPDLPWRYSLGTGTANRLMPWLVLLALRDDEFSDLPQGRALAPRLRVGSVAASLPDLSMAWAFAHVQVGLDAPGGDPVQTVQDDPGRGFARLFALRRLDPDTHYTLFLVPAYEAGRRAALAEETDEGLGTTPAWQAGDAGARDLPWFFRHRFRTEAGQDLETLLRRLRGLPADSLGAAGAPRVVSAGDVGYFDPPPSPGAAFPAQAALRRADAPAPGYDTPRPLAMAMARTLGKVLAGQDAPDEDDEDPLVAFPAYGCHVADRTGVSVEGAAAGDWFDRINLDLKYRAAAGLGQAIVRRNDEHFAALCWDQHDALLEANRELARLQLAERLAAILDRRHFSRLPPEAGLQLAEPLLPHTRTIPGDRASMSVAAHLSDRKVPEGFASLALRRAVARRPVRPEAPVGGPPAPRRVPLPAFPGDRTPSPEAAPRKDGAGQRRAEVLQRDALRDALNAGLRGLFGTGYIARKARPLQPEPQVGAWDSRALHGVLSARLSALPRAKADALIGGRSAPEVAAGGVVWRAPRIPEPLIDHLRRIDPDAILSNVADLPDDTVSFHAENRPFVEALLAGANHAMNEELRWRGYPTDLRGTIFPRFWNRGAAAARRDLDDIGPMRLWRGALGAQPNPADRDGRANLVVVIKGEIVRKLRDPLVEISIAAGAAWDAATAQSHPPVYFGRIGLDAVYYGYDLTREALLAPGTRERAYLAIYEQPGRLRFGLDVGTEAVRRARPRTPVLVMSGPAPDLQGWDDLSWAHMGLTASGHLDVTRTLPRPPQETLNLWGSGKHAAGLARSFWQKPLAALLPLERVL